MPHYSYFLETADQPITPGQPAWGCLLPTDRRSFRDAPAGPQAPSITLGQYFQAVRAFLEGPAQAAVAAPFADGAWRRAAREEIGIFLAKHGECYHPARVAAQACGGRIEWVVNVAVSPAGAVHHPKRVCRPAAPEPRIFPFLPSGGLRARGSEGSTRKAAFHVSGAVADGFPRVSPHPHRPGR